MVRHWNMSERTRLSLWLAGVAVLLLSASESYAGIMVSQADSYFPVEGIVFPVEGIVLSAGEGQLQTAPEVLGASASSRNEPVDSPSSPQSETQLEQSVASGALAQTGAGGMTPAGNPPSPAAAMAADLSKSVSAPGRASVFGRWLEQSSDLPPPRGLELLDPPRSIA